MRVGSVSPSQVEVFAAMAVRRRCCDDVGRTTNDGSASMVAAFRNGGREWLQVRAAAVEASFTV